MVNAFRQLFRSRISCLSAVRYVKIIVLLLLVFNQCFSTKFSLIFCGHEALLFHSIHCLCEIGHTVHLLCFPITTGCINVQSLVKRCTIALSSTVCWCACHPEGRQDSMSLSHTATRFSFFYIIQCQLLHN